MTVNYNAHLNYNAHINYNGIGVTPTPTPSVTGAGSEGADSWSKYLEWLKKKKKKQLKSKAKSLGISTFKADQLTENALKEIKENIELKLSVEQETKILENKTIIRIKAQEIILRAYEDAWQQQFIGDQDDEDAFIILH